MCISLIIISKQVRWREKVVTPHTWFALFLLRQGEPGTSQYVYLCEWKHAKAPLRKLIWLPYTPLLIRYEEPKCSTVYLSSIKPKILLFVRKGNIRWFQWQPDETVSYWHRSTGTYDFRHGKFGRKFIYSKSTPIFRIWMPAISLLVGIETWFFFGFPSESVKFLKS